MTRIAHCPALFIGAPASGQGKTTITAALARHYRNCGLTVRVFKTGPDFLDPMILQRASGFPVYQLDLWMGGEDHCRNLLYHAACEADVILIEGVMGLFDGTTSSAMLAKLFGIPVLAVIDASATAQTFGAIAYGLAHYDKQLPFHGVIANRVGSENHADMLREGMPSDIPLLATISRDAQITLPSRHLGLHQANEITDLDQRLDRAAQLFSNTALQTPPPTVAFASTANSETTALLQNQHIAVAQDQAFSFLYQANLDLLQEMGAQLHYFSPLHDHALPNADSLYLPGGYPELYLRELAANESMKQSIRQHATQHKPIVAECGGMLYLMETLADQHGERANMVGLLPGHATMQTRLRNLGLHSVQLPEGEVRGHTYHHSAVESPLAPLSMSTPLRPRGTPEAVWREDRVHASYIHLYFPSNPSTAASLFAA